MTDTAKPKLALEERRLAELAKRAGLPLQANDDGTELLVEAAEAIELLRIWHELERPEDRTHVLAVARAFVKAQDKA